MYHRRHYTRESEQYLNENELEAFFRAIKAPRDQALFEVAFHRGLRASEVGLLELADVDLARRRIHVHRLKKGLSGFYLLTDRELAAVRRWISERGTLAGPLFPSNRGRPISRKTCHALMRRYATDAGLPLHKSHFHALRHTAGTLLSERLDVIEVQDHLGHRDIRSTMKYLRVRSKRREAIGERLRSAW